MPSKYVVDTNLYIYAVRDLARNRELDAFATANRPSIYLHSTVAGELAAGATSPELKRILERAIAPFEAADRVITPTHGAWKRAGEAIAELVRTKVVSPNGIPRSFLSDCVIAASVRESGTILVTDNVRDFELIRRVFAFEFVPPWP